MPSHQLARHCDSLATQNNLKLYDYFLRLPQTLQLAYPCRAEKHAAEDVYYSGATETCVAELEPTVKNTCKLDETFL